MEEEMRPISAAVQELIDFEPLPILTYLAAIVDLREDDYAEKALEFRGEISMLKAKLEASRQECESNSKAKETKEFELETLQSAAAKIQRNSLVVTSELDQERKNRDTERSQLQDRISELESIAAVQSQTQSDLQHQLDRAKEGFQHQNAEIKELKNQQQLSVKHAVANEKEIGWLIHLIKKMGRRAMATKEQVSQLKQRKAALKLQLKERKACLKRQLKDTLRKLQTEKRRRQRSDRTLRLNLGLEVPTTRSQQSPRRPNNRNPTQRVVEACEEGHEHTKDCVLISHFEDDDDEQARSKNSANPHNANFTPYTVVNGRVPRPLFGGGRLLGAPPPHMHLVLPHFAYNPNCSPAARNKRQAQE